jgi:high-affinity Fe2+/Pb2+ permease
MEGLEVTWERALTVWWSVTWRSALLGLAAGFGIGIAIAVFGGMLNLNPRFVSRLVRLAGVISGLSSAIWALKHVLVMKFRDFKIVLLPLD